MADSTNEPTAAHVPLLRAATVVFLRDAPTPGRDDAERLEVCLLRRNAKSAFVGGASLFPGGAVDPSDGAAESLARCDGLTDAEACARLEVDQDGLAHWFAAAREAFEECGLLPAEHAELGAPLELDDPRSAARFAIHRAQVDAGTRTLASVLETEQLRLDLSGLQYFAHWVTPVGAPRRYDTRFFVGRAPQRQPLTHDGSEVVAAEWVVPAEALARLEAGELSMLPPTSESLRWLTSFASADEALAEAAAITHVPRWEPHFVTELDGSTRIVLDDTGAADGAAPQSWLK